ncbi:MAG: MFS transporter [Pikeienuella sp.]
MTGAPEHDAPSPPGLKGLLAAICAISIFAFGMSLTYPLFAILLERMGATGFEIGLSAAAAAVAMLAGGPILPLLIKRVGAPVLISLSVVAMAVLLMIFPLIPNLWVWIALRFFYGFAAVAVFFCAEIWIVTTAPPARRGFFIGLFGTCLALGFLGGPLLLSVIGTQGMAPFLVSGGLCLCAIGPVMWARHEGPVLTEEEADTPFSMFDVVRFFRTDPAVLWAVALFGAVEFGAMGLIPVWSLRIGLTEQAALLLIALLAAGNVFMNVPMGLISDRFDRRKLLMICAAVSLSASFLIPLLSATTWPLWFTTAIWGGMAVGLYVFALHELGARYSGAAFARGNGAFMSAYGFGALVSPPLMGWGMDIAPPHGMFRVLAAAAGAYLLLLLLRRRPER